MELLDGCVQSGSLTATSDILEQLDPIRVYGRVSQAVGLVVEAYGRASSIGELCVIGKGDAKITAEVVGFKDDRVLLMPLGEMRGIARGALVYATGRKATVGVGPHLLGRVLDGLGRPIDGKGPLGTCEEAPLYAEPINPLARARISLPLDLGVRAVNGLLTCGTGQKMGIFAGSGVGKSVLLGMMARHTGAEVNVIALIGERGREVREFLEKDLKEGLSRSVVVVATSDQPPLVRVRGALTAMAIAEYFRRQRSHVLVLMDSVTRLAQAQREIGLAIGEPPTTKGYTPSVFALLPKVLERVGMTVEGGSMTGLFTILVEGDDLNDPISDMIRSVLDGHIVLSRTLANQNHFPAIDVMSSVSRVMRDIASPEHVTLARELVETLSIYKQTEDLIQIGAYKAGTNPKVDDAIGKMDSIRSYLCQGIDEAVSLGESVADLYQVLGKPL